MSSFDNRDILFASCRHRVTALMLPQHKGKCVTMVGTVDSSQIAEDNLSFHLFVGDRFVEVLLQIPLLETLNNIVEVTGNVDNRCRLQCVLYRRFGSKVPFQLDQYNRTIELIHRYPTCFHCSMSNES